MFLRKANTPRVVQLPSGEILSRADLPAPDTRRWVPGRKRRVANAVRFGLITEGEARAAYGLSPEELAEWMAAALADDGP